MSEQKHLNLWKRRLGRVPESVWEQIGLETLVLADNELTEVSARIGQLKCLRMLDLGHNALHALPESLGDLDGLSDFLYLHNNRLMSLPASLARLKRLRYLNISGNVLETLPECVCEMRSLIELRASDNPLTVLPDSIRQLTSLRELHLEKYQTKIPAGSNHGTFGIAANRSSQHPARISTTRPCQPSSIGEARSTLGGCA